MVLENCLFTCKRMKWDFCITPLNPFLLHAVLMCPKEANLLLDPGFFPLKIYLDYPFRTYYGLKLASNTNLISKISIQIYNGLTL